MSIIPSSPSISPEYLIMPPQPRTQEMIEIIDPVTTTLAQPHTYDVVIIGGGPAGLTAAIYAARDQMDTLVLEGEFTSNTDMPGGQLMLTPEIENFPGFASGSGDDLVTIMRDQAEKFGALIKTERVTTVNFDSATKFVTTSETTYQAHTVIIATGAVARRLGVVGEEKHFGRGVSVCATCDGAFFRNKTVAVVGGGDTAVEDALFLTRFASQVYLIHRRDKLRTNSPEARSLLSHPRVKVMWNSKVQSIVGEDHVEFIELASTKDNDATVSLLEVDGVFVAIGHEPETQFLKSEAGNLVEIADSDYLLTKSRTTHTSVPGVFAAGDVADDIYRQAITAAGSGCQAALDAQRWLQHVAAEHLPASQKGATSQDA